MISIPMVMSIWLYFCANLAQSTILKRLIRHKIITLCLLAIMPTMTIAQQLRIAGDTALNGYFANPVKGYVTCVGSFAELRRNHFHGGLDIRTGGQIGVPLYAAADGYISRINISAWGYGNCLYIAHPVGYTTVYGHINNFAPKIEEWITKVQYQEQLSELEAYPKASVIPVKKGELIAYSGNSGGSSGPHLHFEVRKTDIEAPTNPLLFNMDITEKLGPKFLSLYLHEYDADFIKTDGYLPYTYIGLPQGLTRKVAPGKYAISARIRDYFQSYGENMGINYLEMLKDDSVIFSMNIEQFTFGETRALNSIIDYAMYKKSGLMAYRFFKDEGNMLPWYPSQRAEYGILDLPAEQVESVKITLRAYDVNMKKAEISFNIMVDVDATSKVIRRNDTPTTPLVNFDKEFIFNPKGVSVYMKEHTLYNSMYLSYDINSNNYGKRITLFDHHIPFHKPVTVGLYVENAGEHSIDKFYIRNNGKDLVTKRAGNWLYAEGKYAGTFDIALDETAPYIKAYSTGYHGYFRFSISDGGSGIKDYRAEVDGQFMVMEFDGKYARLTGKATKERFGTGKHTFTLVVTDYTGNQRKLSYIFYL